MNHCASILYDKGCHVFAVVSPIVNFAKIQPAAIMHVAHRNTIEGSRA